MFKKSTLKTLLPAAMLVASTSAFAADGEVKIASGTKTWSEVVTALNQAGDLTALQQAVANAQSAAQLVEPKTETVAKEWLQEQQTAANTFLASYTSYTSKEEGATGSEGTIYYKAVEDLDEETVLTVSFINVSGLTPATPAQFYTEVMKKADGKFAKDVVTLYVDLGKDNYSKNNGIYTVTSYTNAQQKNLVSLVATLLDTTLPALKEFQDTQNTEEYDNALAEVTAAQNNLSAAQTAQKDYAVITLNGNIDVTEGQTIDSYAGTIIGGGYVFNVPDGQAAFTQFSGKLSKAAVNGEFATSTTGATFDNVAMWNNGVGNYYDATGAGAEYTTIGELGYAARTNFGVASSKLATVTADNKVYNITVYTSAAEAPTYYVTNANGAYTNVNNNQAVTVGDNVFVKTATADLTGTNVIYNGTATKVEIKDGADFYCPEDVTADEVSYDRAFKQGHNAVCLPFAVNGADIDATLSIYEKQDEQKFWFTITEGTIAANTPMLLYSNAGGALPTLKNVTIGKTENQIVEGANGSFGTLKKANVQEILGASNANKVYGLTPSGEFMFGGATANCPAFRMFIECAEVALGAPRRVAFLNGYGEEVDMTGVEEVAADAAALEVVGGNGEIVINASSDLGAVAVYTLDGKVAANADVVAGANTVNVAKGVYVVMGKKVLVK